MRPIRIALTKGRLEEKSIEMFEQLGYDCSEVRNKGRRLVLPIKNANIEIILAKAADVITYVENGVCDLGVVGKDTIMENGGTFYEVADLGFGRCRFALAVPAGADFYAGYHTRCIASKYVNVTRNYFEKKPPLTADVLVMAAGDEYLVKAILYRKQLIAKGQVAENCVLDDRDAAIAYAERCGIAQVHVIGKTTEIIDIEA